MYTDHHPQVSTLALLMTSVYASRNVPLNYVFKMALTNVLRNTTPFAVHLGEKDIQFREPTPHFTFHFARFGPIPVIFRAARDKFGYVVTSVQFIGENRPNNPRVADPVRPRALCK